MKQFNTALHTAHVLFKKLFLPCSACLFITLVICNTAKAQCSVNPVTDQVVCHGILTTPINFTGTATTFNWVNNNPNIGLPAFGSGNINSFTGINNSNTPVVASITVTPSNGACTGTPVTFTITVNPPPPVYIIPNASCGTCGSLTGAGASTYSWSPTAGLYTDCQRTQAYTGGPAGTVYTTPTSTVLYQLTGTNAANGCRGSTFGTINYAPAAPIIIPSSVNMCLGDGPVKLKAFVPGSRSFCSGPVNIAVPDNNPAGAFSTIPVSGIPATASLTHIWVTINMQHTRVGNMVFVLKAPNGAVLNLDYHLGGTGGSGSTTGFSNTIITSAGLLPFTVGSDPYSGSFRADAQATAAGGFGASGPAGMIPTVTNWSALVPVTPAANGNWTLGFYDGVTGDAGTLQDWCISLAYQVIPGQTVTRPVVWSPVTGLFTDPAALIPYIAGTAVDSVYARPVPAGSYPYQAVSTALPPSTCISAPTTVTVNVLTGASITSQPTSLSFCNGGGTAVFTVGATGALSYQWQLSTNGGASWNNIVNGGPYSGVNTATLVINPVTTGMNGYLYRLQIGSCSGPVLSNPASLTLSPVPTVTITANPLVILPTQTSTITSTVTPNPATSYAWYYNGALLPGEVSPSLLVNYGAPGDYQLKVTDANNCGVGVSNIVTIANNFTSNIYLYPNPGSGRFTVQYYSVAGNPLQRTIQVYDNRGNKVFTRSFLQTVPFQKTEVDIRSHGRGMYWVELLDGNGNRLTVRRVVVR